MPPKQNAATGSFKAPSSTSTTSPIKPKSAAVGGASTTPIKPTSSIKPIAARTTTTSVKSAGVSIKPAAGWAKMAASSSKSDKEPSLKPMVEEKEPPAPVMSEAEARHRTTLCKYDEDQDEALSMKELANLIRDVLEEEFQFCENHEVGPYIQRQMKAGDKDGDRKLNDVEFIAWHTTFREYIDGLKEEASKKEEAKAKAKASALRTMMDKIERGELCDCHMTALPQAIEASLKQGRTPLIIDATVATEGESFSPLEVFYGYSGDAVIEMKKMVVEVNMQKTRPLQEALDQIRKVTVGAMRYGKDLVVMCSNSAPPITSQFTQPTTFPLALLDANQVNAIRAKTMNEWPEDSFIHTLIPDPVKDECTIVHKDFKVYLLTKFAVEDYVNFLKAEVPLHHMQHIKVYSS